MSPAYNSQLLSNSPLVSIGWGDINPYLLLNAETPAAGARSIAVAIQPKTASSGPVNVSFLFKCPGGIGAGVFEVEESDEDVDASYTSVAFGGASPGQVTGAVFVTPAPGANTAKVTLTLRARFVRVLCVTAPGAPITVGVSL